MISLIEITLNTVLLDTTEEGRKVTRQRWWCAGLLTIDQEKEESDPGHSTLGVCPQGWGTDQVQAVDQLILRLETLVVQAKKVREEIGAKQ